MIHPLVLPHPEMYPNWSDWARALMQALDADEQHPQNVVPSTSVLPAPNHHYRGCMYLLTDPAGDQLHICRWNGAAFVWTQLI